MAGAYWEGKCPVDDQSLNGASFIWSDILKNPSQSTSNFSVDLQFPHPLPMTGCVGFVLGGGPGVEGEVTISTDLNLSYGHCGSDANTVWSICRENIVSAKFGLPDATTDDEEGFAPTMANVQ